MSKKTIAERFVASLVKIGIFMKEVPPDRVLIAAQRNKLSARKTLLLWAMLKDPKASTEELLKAGHFSDTSKQVVEDALKDISFQLAFLEAVDLKVDSAWSPEKIALALHNLLQETFPPRTIIKEIGGKPRRRQKKETEADKLDFKLPPTNK
jgi:hypothetical protein